MKDTSNYGKSSGASDNETGDFIEINGEDLALSLDMIQQSEVLPHHRAGYIYQTEGTGSRCFEIQKDLHKKHGHPFYPWKNEDELWLADFMFMKAKMSISVSDKLLDGIRCGRMKMRCGDLSYSGNKHLMEQLDKAQFITVSLAYFQNLSENISISSIVIRYTCIL